MKKLFLRAEFGPFWEPWEEDEIGRKNIPHLYLCKFPYPRGKKIGCPRLISYVQGFNVPDIFVIP